MGTVCPLPSSKNDAFGFWDKQYSPDPHNLFSQAPVSYTLRVPSHLKTPILRFSNWNFVEISPTCTVTQMSNPSYIPHVHHSNHVIWKLKIMNVFAFCLISSVLSLLPWFEVQTPFPNLLSNTMEIQLLFCQGHGRSPSTKTLRRHWSPFGVAYKILIGKSFRISHFEDRLRDEQWKLASSKIWICNLTVTNVSAEPATLIFLIWRSR
jgi:hypothetical protein